MNKSKKAEDEFNLTMKALMTSFKLLKTALDIAYGTFIATTDVASAVNSFNSSLQAYL